MCLNICLCTRNKQVLFTFKLKERKGRNKDIFGQLEKGGYKRIFL